MRIRKTPATVALASFLTTPSPALAAPASTTTPDLTTWILIGVGAAMLAFWIFVNGRRLLAERKALRTDDGLSEIRKLAAKGSTFGASTPMPPLSHTAETATGGRTLPAAPLASPQREALEAQAAHLERLIAQANEKLRQLDAAISRADRKVREAQALGISTSQWDPAPAPAAFQHTRLPCPEYGRAPAAAPVAAVEALPSRPEPAFAGAHASTARPGVQRVDALTRRVYELADAGLSSVEIASQLQEHTGKIDLILALRGR